MVLAALVLLACALRLVHLGRFSLWLDEGTTWWNATRATWLATALVRPEHPPLWSLVTRMTIRFIGDSEAALRLPAAACSILAVGLTILLGRRLFRDGPRDGPVLLLAALAASNGFLIEYAQEARMYSCLLAESLGLSLLLLDWLDHRRARSLVAYGLLGALAMMTHYFAIWPMLGHAVFVLVLALRERSRAAVQRVALLGAVQAATLVAPVAWLVWTLQDPHPVGVAVGGRFDAFERLLYSLWRIGVGPALAAIDRPRVDAGLRAFAHEEFVVIAATAILWGVPLLLGAIRLRKHPETGTFLATGILVPALALLVAQFRLPLMHEKYLIYLAPLLLATAAFGAWGAPRRLRPVLIGGLLLVNLAGLAAYEFPDAKPVATAFVHGHPYGHEQWREFHEAVEARGDTGTAVVLAHGYLDRVWLYYDRGRHPIVRLPESWPSRPPRDRALVEAMKGRAWFVFAHDKDVDRRADLATIARAAGMRREDVEARVVLWPRGWGIRVLAWPPESSPALTPENAANR